MKINLIKLSGLACIPLIGVGIYLDVIVFNNHPFMNIGKWLGVLAVIQLAICGALNSSIKSQTEVTSCSTEDRKGLS